MAPKESSPDLDEHQAFVEEFDRDHDAFEIMGRHGDSYRYDASEVLAKVDPMVFREEALGWQTDQRERHKQGATDRLVDEDSKLHLKNLTVLCGRNRVIPFVGAGMSKDSGFELWSEFIAREGKAWQVAGVLKLLKKGRYEEALEALLAKASYNLIQTSIDNTFGRSDIKVAGPVALLPKLFRAGMITTNFDSVIEQAIASGTTHVIKVRQGDKPQEIIRMLKEGENCLLKLHGQGSSRDGRILSKAEYDKHYGPQGSPDLTLVLPRTLSHAFQNMTLLFLGCSLVTDRTLEVFSTIMGAIGSEVETIPRHYAILPDPGNSRRPARRTSLSKMNIYPLFYRCSDPSDHSEAVHDILTSILAHTDK